MSIKLTYGKLRQPQLFQALAKMAMFKDYKSVKAAYNVARIHKAAVEESKVCDELLIDISKKYAVKDDKGEVALSPEGAWTPAPDTLAECQQKMKELEEIEFTINYHPVKVDDLDGVKLSPIELLALEPLLAPDLSVVKDPAS